MIVPRYRLIFWVGVFLIPTTLLTAAGTTAGSVFGGLTAALIVAALLDAVAAIRNLREITISLPEVVRFSRRREGSLPICIRNPKMKAGTARVGFPFPDEIQTPDMDFFVRLAADAPLSTASRPCTPMKSGRYAIAAWHLEIASPAGLWDVRKRGAARTEVRVYPNLLCDRNSLAALFLKRQFGMHAQRQMGKGHDFEQLRDYLPGDNYEDIYWKATARRRYPVTKVFQIERTQRIYVIVDGSRLSARCPTDALSEGSFDRGRAGTYPETIMDRFIASAMVMGLAAERQGDLFGVLTFNDQSRVFLEAKRGKRHFDACREALYTLQAKSVSPDFSELFVFIGTRIRRRSLLIFLVNLDDPVLSEIFTQSIELISKKHLVLVAMVKPAAANPLFSSEAVTCGHDLYRHLGGHVLWESLRETEKGLQRRGIGFALLDSEKMSAQLVSRYIGIKQRQVL
jgi:uncharacterized protein (DUF58 family)